MAYPVIMPKQGLQMTEGFITKWLVGEGKPVIEGQPLFEMETDKVTLVIDAQTSGTLLKITRPAGEVVPIAETIAYIGDPGENISGLEASVKALEANPLEKPSTGEKVFITPRARTIAAENQIDFAQLNASGPDGLIIEKDITDHLARTVKATPLARKMAENSQIDLQAVPGTGSRGKITKSDVHKAATGRRGTLRPFAGVRKIIAERMLQSLQTNAQTTHRVCVDMSEAIKLKDIYKKADKAVSYNDLIAFAVCRSLLEHPAINAELTADGILIKDYVNLGIAVAVDNGLIVPVIKDADLLTLAELSAAARALAQKAKDGRLEPDDYRGGSFTLSNLGMLGLDDFVAIINPPECGILAAGKIEKRAVVVEDQLMIRPMMNLVLSYDHRLVDGAPAAEFLVKVKQLLENPYLML